MMKNRAQELRPARPLGAERFLAAVASVGGIRAGGVAPRDLWRWR